MNSVSCADRTTGRMAVTGLSSSRRRGLPSRGCPGRGCGGLPGPGQVAGGGGCLVGEDCLAVIDTLAPVIDRINGELHARRQGRPAGQGVNRAARSRGVHHPGDAGRDRRHQPVRKRA